MSATSLPHDLLDQARFLLAREKRRPKQASLRRAISSSYYAVFHLLGAEASRLLAPNVSSEIQHRIRRWLDHGEMKVVCGGFAQSSSGNPYRSLLDPAGNLDLQTLAANFIALQSARHDADYDLNTSYSRPEAAAFVQQAADCFSAWKRIQKTSDANVFLLSLLMRKRWDQPR